jgi:hypothetical protein
MSARKSPMPTAKPCFRLGEMASASQERTPRTVSARKRSPLTKTTPRSCGHETPRAARPNATKAFSPMYGATAIGRFA